jgi:hypothetical protein
LRRHWPAYERKFGPRLLPSHRHAVRALLSCRTAALGAQLFGCGCGQRQLVYHSCNHRACPQCGHADATAWLAQQRRKLLADVQPVGSGEPALKYLAAYVYRTAFSAEKIVADDGQHVTFSYRDNTGKNGRCQLSAEKFLHRFLQHVLPRGLQRVRHFGWLSAAAKERFARIRALLDWQPPPPLPAAPGFIPHCPCCKKPMQLMGRLARPPPWRR